LLPLRRNITKSGGQDEEKKIDRSGGYFSVYFVLVRFRVYQACDHGNTFQAAHTGRVFFVQNRGQTAANDGLSYRNLGRADRHDNDHAG
jgi:hypothetical protein